MNHVFDDKKIRRTDKEIEERESSLYFFVGQNTLLFLPSLPNHMAVVL